MQAKATRTRFQVLLLVVAELVADTELNTTLATTAKDALVSAYGATQNNLQAAHGQDHTMHTFATFVFKHGSLQPTRLMYCAN